MGGVAAFEDVLRDGQQSGRSSAQPMMGASIIPPSLITSAVYIGIVHVPTSSDWPVNGVVGKVMCVEGGFELPSCPVACAVVLGVGTEGIITLVKPYVLD